MLSTSKIAEKHYLTAKPHLFDFLLNNQFIITKNNSYKLTEKGKINGGVYFNNKKGKNYIVWDESKFYNVIKIFKLEILKQCEIATIDHMTHIKNLESILKYGLFSHNNLYKKIDISNQDVNNRRSELEPIYQKSIHEYVPFYFNARNAMLYRNQKKFGNKIIILGFSNEIVFHDKVIFTNANAAADNTFFTNDITELLNNDFIDFSKVFSYSWNNYGEPDDYLKQTMMSEVLIEKYVDKKYIQFIYCQDNDIKNYIEKNFNINNIQVITEPNIFF